MNFKMEEREKARLIQDVNIIAVVIINTELFMALTAKANKKELEQTQLKMKESILAPALVN